MASDNRPDVTRPRRRRRRKRALTAWGWIIAICVGALIATYVRFVEPPPPYSLVIASGGHDGAYFHNAKKYAAELERDGLSVEVRETKGSVENLSLLAQADSGVDVAIMQGGVASSDEVGRFLALGSLYHEPLWVFYRGDERLKRVGQLVGKRIGVGPPGSGTLAIATQLLGVNGVSESASSQSGSRTVLVQQDVAAAAKALQAGELDAAFFVAAFEAEYIQTLLNDSHVKLMDFDQQDAYCRRFRFLAPVTLVAGIVNIGQNIPDKDVALVAPTAMLVVRKDFHPALIPLLLASAARVHSKGDVVSNQGEFPSDLYCDFTVSEDAKRYYRSGQPVLQRLLPFWVASLVDRTKVMLIPLIMLMMPLVRTAPPLMRWRTRRKIYVWYSELRDIDQQIAAGLSPLEVEKELARLRKIEQQVTFIDVPLSYAEEFYNLRTHISLLQQNLMKLQARGEPIIGDPAP